MAGTSNKNEGIHNGENQYRKRIVWNMKKRKSEEEVVGGFKERFSSPGCSTVADGSRKCVSLKQIVQEAKVHSEL